MSNGPGTGVGYQLLVEEYKSCRELILKNIDIMERTEVYATGACAAIFVFSLQASDQFVSVTAAWLSPMIAVLGLFRFHALDQVIHRINDYLVEVETKNPPLQYTSYYRAHNPRKVLTMARTSVWIALLVLTTFGAVYLTVRCRW